jgi:hypothetical protein
MSVKKCMEIIIYNSILIDTDAKAFRVRTLRPIGYASQAVSAKPTPASQGVQNVRLIIGVLLLSEQGFPGNGLVVLELERGKGLFI